ncbi:GntR family transcriptional regulator [Amnibacterium flavum]|uniref:GntR family transcriptional regulator n=2 Tax=Amnibacterium flavum TaxID=2173173 RepID=A0A2V1HV50_9MICO|nr:GntR family transcriptional regulator [Amnibacterium flavum]PVZ94899.1 GntR family transcriptional regulator [Amnibacterium flavum]
MTSFAIDSSSSIPPSEQVRAWFAQRIAGGELSGGSKLPTVRGLAEQLGLATNTVAKAYRELETDGFIDTRGRNGSFVIARGDAAEREAQAAALAYAQRMHRLGITAEDAERFVSAALRAAP